MKTNVWLSRTIGALLIIGASIALFLAQSSYWVNNTISNQSSFTETTTKALLQQSSRDAIASTVVDKTLENRPIVQRVIGDRAGKLVSSLLDSDFSSQALSRVIGTTYKYITTTNRQDIVVELEAIKVPVSRIISLAQAEDSNAAATIDSIPDEIVLVESESFPDLSRFVQIMLWVGPLFWLATIALFAAYIYMHRAKYDKAVYVVGASIGVVALLGILARPVLPPPIASMVPQSELRPVVQNVSDAFLALFQAQMVFMLIAVIIVITIFSLRRVIARQFQKLTTMISAKTSEDAARSLPTKKK